MTEEVVEIGMVPSIENILIQIGKLKSIPDIVHRFGLSYNVNITELHDLVMKDIEMIVRSMIHSKIVSMTINPELIVMITLPIAKRLIKKKCNI